MPRQLTRPTQLALQEKFLKIAMDEMDQGNVTRVEALGAALWTATVILALTEPDAKQRTRVVRHITNQFAAEVEARAKDCREIARHGWPSTRN